jgi:hypothetical protein
MGGVAKSENATSEHEKSTTIIAITIKQLVRP